MKLLVYKNGTVVQELELLPGSTMIAGRKSTCDIVLDKRPGISREHFSIEEDQTGQWLLRVLSKVTPIKFDGSECYELTLEDNMVFSLQPYRFQYVIDDQVSKTNEDSVEKALQTEVDKPSENNIDFNSIDAETAEDSASEKTFIGNDEKTSIKEFSGTPYIKIIGQNGKKSEFFRLEGNLWIAGRGDSASIYIPDASASQSHFEIAKTDRGFFLSDLGAAEGTSLNGQKLEPNKPTQIHSGDIITIGAQSLQFELRDQAFKKKVSNIPLHMYQNPLVFFEQETALVMTEGEEVGTGRVEEVQFETAKKTTKKKLLLIAAVCAVIASVAVNVMGEKTKDNTVQNESADPFTRLDPSQQKIVTQTHNLAKQLYLNGNFELALVQLQKLHSIIPQYKDSQEIEKYCMSSRDLKREQALREQQRREAEQLQEQVASFIAQCSQRFSRSHDLDGARACLAPAMQMDPNNPEISQIFADISARQEERKVRRKMAQEQADKIRRGKELYTRARQYHKKNNFLKAMEAYENHIHSGLPDPSKLVKKSKRSLSSIEYMIKTKKSNLMNSAKTKYGSSQLKEAVRLARKAQKVDPYDYTISTFLINAEKELTSKVKSIYMDSVIEERFGNLEASRIKWEEIMRIDIENGPYYKKAQRKMKTYGYKH